MFKTVLFFTTVITIWISYCTADDVSDVVGPCWCDLSGSRCDINCCCDSDCSSSDRQIFSQCIDAITSPVTVGCNKITLTYQANTTVQNSTGSADSILCVYNDNYAARKNYTTPSLITTTTAFTTTANTYRNYIFNVSLPSFTGSSTNTSVYQKGDPIYVLYLAPSALGRLTLPKAVTGSFCNDNNIANYLTSESSTCTRDLSPATCTTATSLNYATYAIGFCVISLSKNAQSYLSGNTATTQTSCNNIVGAISVSVTCSLANGSSISCAAPSSTGGVCNNIVTEVSYAIVYDSTTGITQVNAQIKLDSGYSTAFKQKFSITFTSTSTNAAVVARSGNPGYLAGYPLLVGSLLTSTNTSGVITNLTAWTVPAGGDCLTSTTRTTVTFGQNIRSGCLYKLNSSFSSICPAVQASILNVLRGTPYQVNGTMRVATWGNASTSAPDDWVPVLENDANTQTTGSSSTCSKIIVGATVQVLFARTGSLSYPQNKIVGVRYNYIRGDVRFSCGSVNCINSAIIQNVEITISVNFIDTSSSLTNSQKQVPIFLSRLPYDFFYPFFM